jgi:hypothetical protein
MIKLATNLYGCGEKRNAFIIMAEKPEGKRLLGRPKCRCNNIQVSFTEIKCKGVE